MSFLRALVFPTALATPLWLWITPVFFRGLDALKDFAPAFSDLFFGALFTLVGLLVVGLPVSTILVQQRWRSDLRALTLLCAGAVGGGLIAILFVLIPVTLADGFNLQTLLRVLPISLMGVVPGIIVSLVWMTINFDQLGEPLKEKRHA